MSIKSAQKNFTRKMNDFDIFTKIATNVDDLDKKLLPPVLNRCPKCKKLPNLVTLAPTNRKSTKVFVHLARTSLIIGDTVTRWLNNLNSRSDCLQ